MTVPLPSSGPHAPPSDVRDAVNAWPWRGGLEPCGDVDVAPLPADAVEGVIPPELAGSLYRVGPGRIRLGTKKYAHWFDGDGFIFAIHLDPATNTARAGAKMVRTERYERQEARGGAAANAVSVRGAWTQADSVFDNVFAFPTNPGNTSPMFHAGSLLVLCEGGAPYEVDATSLRTKGVKVFGSNLPMGFSAHAKRDADGTLYTWGLAKPPAIGMSVAKITKDGAVEKVVPLPLNGPEMTLMHDAAMSENYLAFIVPPWKLPMGAMAGALSGAGSFGHAFRWAEEDAAWMVIMRKSDLSVVHATEIPRMSTYHFATAYERESDGTLHVLVNRLIGPRPELERNFSDMYAAVWSAPGYNTLCDYVVDLKSGKLLSSEPVVPPTVGGARGGDARSGQLPMEFPVIARAARGRAPEYVYTLGFSGGGAGYFDAIQKLHVGSGTHATRISPPGTFPSEVEFVPRGDGSGDEDDGYLLYVEYDANAHKSSVVILDAKDVEGDVVARIRLPFHVPHTFHGTYRANAAR